MGAADSAQAYTITQTETGKHVRWSIDTVAFRAAPSFRYMLNEGEPESALTMAMEAWRGYPGVPELVMVDGNPGPPGHGGPAAGNSIHLLRWWPYPPQQLAVTVVTYEVQTGRMLDTDILLNGEVSYEFMQEDAPQEAAPGDERHYDLAAVLTHESGHVLGLGESHDDHDATMWPYATPGDTHQRTLADDDEDGVIKAYEGPPPEAAAGCGTASVGGSRVRSKRFAWLWVVPWVLLVLVRKSNLSRWLLAGAFCTASLLALATWGNFRVRIAEGSRSALNIEASRSQRAVPKSDRGPAVGSVDAVVHQKMPSLKMIVGEKALAPVDPLDPLRTGRPAAASKGHAGRHTQASEDSDFAQAALAALLKDMPIRHVGRAHRMEVDRGMGLWSTRYELHTPDGETVNVWLPGGSDGEIAQRVGAEPLPADGSELLVAQDQHGRTAWTYHHEGRVYGGALFAAQAELRD